MSEYGKEYTGDSVGASPGDGVRGGVDAADPDSGQPRRQGQRRLPVLPCRSQVSVDRSICILIIK